MICKIILSLINKMSTLEQIFKTQPYLAIRIMSEFDDDVIAEIRDSGQYNDLFTPTMQNQLYKLKLENELTEDEFEQLSKLQFETRIPWSRIYQIYYNGLRSIDSIYENDDVGELRIYGLFHPTYYNQFIDYIIISSKMYIPMTKRIQMYIVENGMISSLDDYYNYLSALGLYSDIAFIKTLLPYIKRNLDEIITATNYYETSENIIKSRLYTGAIFGVNVGVFDYLMDNGVVPNGEDMAFIAYYIKHDYPERIEVIPHLISRGADHVDRDFYREEFGEEY